MGRALENSLGREGIWRLQGMCIGVHIFQEMRKSKQADSEANSLRKGAH